MPVRRRGGRGPRRPRYRRRPRFPRQLSVLRELRQRLPGPGAGPEDGRRSRRRRYEVGMVHLRYATAGRFLQVPVQVLPYVQNRINGYVRRQLRRQDAGPGLLPRNVPHRRHPLPVVRLRVRHAVRLQRRGQFTVRGLVGRRHRRPRVYVLGGQHGPVRMFLHKGVDAVLRLSRQGRDIRLPPLYAHHDKRRRGRDDVARPGEGASQIVGRSRFPGLDLNTGASR